MSDELKITLYKWLINSEWHIHNELISIRNDFDRRSFHILKVLFDVLKDNLLLLFDFCLHLLVSLLICFVIPFFYNPFKLLKIF